MTNENNLPEENDKIMTNELMEETEAAGGAHLDADIEVNDLAEEKPIDFTTYKKIDFVNLVKDLSKEDNFKRIDSLLKEIKPLYDEIREHEKKAALEKYLTEGGTKEDFEFRIDDLDHLYDATLKFIKDKRNSFYKSLEDRKNESLKHKNEILEKLRALVDGEDSPQAFQQFKELQKEWKNSGPVPVAHLKMLWANYNAIIDRFYDHRNIYFELKELDRKKNLEAKKELCVRAEKLADVKSIQDAVKELNELHHEFKHIGPVPKEEQEPLWQRFKAASDAVYAKRDVYTANLLVTLQQNEATKILLNEEVSAFGAFSSDRIKDWNQKTKDILELQKKWDAVGAAPRAHQRELNKKFWTAFKLFFHNKNVFFKKLDEERVKNLKIKEALVQRAIELKENQDWEKTSNELKNLQLQWKEVGPVPEKWREKIYQQFKEACDHFFGQRRGLLEKADQEQELNLIAKEALLAELERISSEKTGTLQQIREIQNKFNTLGFVPKRAVASIKSRFNELVSRAISSMENLSATDKEQAALEIQLSSLKSDPDAERKIYHKEQTIRKQISKAENDIAVLQNNLSFFDRAKNADVLKAEYGNKIKEAGEHLVQLKKQLKMLNQPAQGL
ncbi:MAG: DUF349 domain-containing protein [Cytophagales bacterium]|jgi:hypothetical protein|nr:DUF349 domain-containing protein [Cytophagales bacterium]MCA6389199.1 DUF349 domain-containing protein [Cytophagales bacterium]MCA6390348.1 DUF349 domain-containing protein [Cytophagales bacterium]MCA6394334.1 DUF349 domain-containing protein [Cytophagales bacterium]MCA6399788.1 DUF349 domain-containing protein [Cytophagales bacterium]